MALTSTEITNLQTARASLISALATHTGEDPITAEYTIMGRRKVCRSLDEIMRAIEQIEKLISLSTSGSPSTRVSYGRPRRFS